MSVMIELSCDVLTLEAELPEAAPHWRPSDAIRS
jgi:hypothetical protein